MCGLCAAPGSPVAFPTPTPTPTPSRAHLPLPGHLAAPEVQTLETRESKSDPTPNGRGRECSCRHRHGRHPSTHAAAVSEWTGHRNLVRYLVPSGRICIQAVCVGASASASLGLSVCRSVSVITALRAPRQNLGVQASVPTYYLSSTSSLRYSHVQWHDGNKTKSLAWKTYLRPIAHTTTAVQSIGTL